MTMPILVEMAVKRQPETQTPGRYSEKEEMWVVVTENGEIPLIEVDHKLSELATKTKTEREEDDEFMPRQEIISGLSLVHFRELLTKTEAEPEQDEEEIQH